MFEKYDGMRAIWHPFERTFYSRWGTPINVRPYLTDCLSGKYWLDGEISCVLFLV
jgi:ATP-dependent DNA ligase